MADIPDILRVMDTTPTLVAAPVTARNFLASAGAIAETFADRAPGVVVRAGSGDPLAEASDIIEWLVAQGR